MMIVTYFAFSIDFFRFCTLLALKEYKVITYHSKDIRSILDNGQREKE